MDINPIVQPASIQALRSNDVTNSAILVAINQHAIGTMTSAALIFVNSAAPKKTPARTRQNRAFSSEIPFQNATPVAAVASITAVSCVAMCASPNARGETTSAAAATK